MTESSSIGENETKSKKIIYGQVEIGALKASAKATSLRYSQKIEPHLPDALHTSGKKILFSN
jgi:hypothetical protein